MKSDDPYLLSADAPLQHDVDFSITQSKDSSNIAELFGSGSSRFDSSASFCGLGKLLYLHPAKSKRTALEGRKTTLLMTAVNDCII